MTITDQQAYSVFCQIIQPEAARVGRIVAEWSELPAVWQTAWTLYACWISDNAALEAERMFEEKINEFLKLRDEEEEVVARA